MTTKRRLPEWLKVKAPGGPNYIELKNVLRGHGLHTVCEEAHCPNIGGCWERRTATFMILGSVCTRACRYCAVTSGRPEGLDLQEPVRLAETVVLMGLKYAVITSVNRDDLPDGGAFVFAECIRQIRKRIPDCKVEVLIPDFEGNRDALNKVMDSEPDTLNHNIETVRRVFRSVRPKGGYDQSLELLARVKESYPNAVTKSGMMVGLGETRKDDRRGDDARPPSGGLRPAHDRPVPASDAAPRRDVALVHASGVRRASPGGGSARLQARGVGTIGAQLVPR